MFPLAVEFKEKFVGISLKLSLSQEINYFFVNEKSFVDVPGVCIVII